jgi:6-phosphogluconate dehydrogenase (decarboxylating)
MLLVPAGKPVDADVIDNLIPHLEKGDIIIDGGKISHVDTVRRVKYVSEKGFHFMGMGFLVAKKERRGPSIMPGGDVKLSSSTYFRSNSKSEWRSLVQLTWERCSRTLCENGSQCNRIRNYAIDK